MKYIYKDSPWGAVLKQDISNGFKPILSSYHEDYHNSDSELCSDIWPKACVLEETLLWATVDLTSEKGFDNQSKEAFTCPEVFYRYDYDPKSVKIASLKSDGWGALLLTDIHDDYRNVSDRYFLIVDGRPIHLYGKTSGKLYLTLSWKNYQDMGIQDGKLVNSDLNVDYANPELTLYEAILNSNSSIRLISSELEDATNRYIYFNLKTN